MSDAPDYSDFAVPAATVAPLSPTAAAVGPDYSDFNTTMAPQGTNWTGAPKFTLADVQAAAKAANVDPDLYARLIFNGEGSNGVAQVISPKGAVGPAQLLPPTAKALGVNPYDTAENLKGGALYLAQQLKHFGGDKTKAVAAYNAGPQAVDAAGGVPNFPETQAYVPRVLGGPSPTGPMGGSAGGMSDADAEAAYQAAHGAAPATAPVTHIEWNPKTNRYEDNAGTPYQRTGATTVAGPNGSQFQILPNAPAPSGQIPIQPLDSGTRASSLSDMVNEEERRAPLAGFQQGLENIGSTFANLDQGVENTIPFARQFNQFLDGPGAQTVDQKVQALHANRLMNDARFAGLGGYDAGKVGGEIAGTAPFLMATAPAAGALAAPIIRAAPALAPVADFLGGTGGGNMFMRGASQVANGAFLGGEGAAFNAGGSDQPFGQQVGAGMLAGGVLGPVIPAAASAARSMFESPLSPAVSDLADAAVNKYGIPLDVRQIKAAAGDRAAGYQYSNDLGRLGTGGAQNNAKQWDAFSKAVTGTYGDLSGVMTPANMSAARSRIGGEIGRIASSNDITNADDVLGNIGGVVHDASQYATDSQIAPMLKLTENIGSVVTPGLNGAPATISGPAYAKLIAKGSPLDRAMNSPDGTIRNIASSIRDALDDGFEASVSPDDLKDFQNARFQYKNLMTIADLAKKANVEGQISPQLLQGAVNKSFKNRAFQGAGDLGELSTIAQTFMKEPPQSGSVPRLVDMLKSAPGMGAMVDTGIAFHDPVLALQLAAGGGTLMAARTAANAIRGAVNRSPMVRNALINGVNPGPVGNAFLGAANAYRPALLGAGEIGANNMFLSPYKPQTFLPAPSPQSAVP